MAREGFGEELGGGGVGGRIVCNPEFKALFVEMYNNFDGGRFYCLLTQQNSTSNMVKNSAWKNFTAEFNARSTQQVSKNQLQEYHKRMVKNTRKHNKAIQAARNAANRTGGGPPLPEPDQLDGDTPELENPLRLPGLAPVRDQHSAVTTADGRVIR